jgi:hypothetical protein
MLRRHPRTQFQQAGPETVTSTFAPDSAHLDQQQQKKCRFQNSVADGDASTCGFAEFSSKWRMGFSHLRGGS